MAHYVEKNLRPTEHLVAKAKISWVPLIPTFVLSFLILGGGILTDNATSADGVISIIAFIVAFLFVLIGIIRISSIELGVTDKKIIGKVGVIIVNSLDTYLEKIDNFSISESLGGKIFGYSTIQICTTSAKLRFGYVKDAMAFKHTVMDCIDAREQEKMYQQADFFHKLMDPNSFPANSNPMAQPAPAPAYAPQGSICPACGRPVKPGSSFCAECGTRVQ